MLKVLSYLGRNPQIGYTTLTLFFFFGHIEQHGELPQPGTEPEPPALEARILTIGPPGGSGHFNSCSK